MIYPKTVTLLSCTLFSTAILSAQNYVVSGDVDIPTGTYDGIDILNDGDVGNVQSGAVVTLNGKIQMGTAATAPGDIIGFNLEGGDVEFTAHTDVQLMPRANGGTANFTVNSGNFNMQSSYFRINFRAPDGNRGAGGDVMNLNFNNGSSRFDIFFLNSDNSPDGTEATNPIVNFNLAGGYVEYRGIEAGTNSVFGPNNHVYINISGGELNNSNLTRNVSLGEFSTVHVIGSAATNIEMLALDFQSNARMMFTVDGGGITPITTGGGANDTYNGIIDMDWSVEPSDGQIFTIVDSTGSSDYSGLTLDPADLTNWSLITGGEDLQVMYSAVPEPGAMALGVAGLVFGLTALRRRKRA